MTVKTITITENAYNALKQLKRGEESFSEAILRAVPRKATINDWLGALKDSPRSVEAHQQAVAEIRRQMGEKMQERIKHVRSRH